MLPTPLKLASLHYDETERNEVSFESLRQAEEKLEELTLHA